MAAATGRISKEGEILEGFLRERGMKMTVPRWTVLKAFLGVKSHVTAEELLAAARRLDPSIGQATVFRTVKLLAQAGIAREAQTTAEGKRYERAYGATRHDHLICLGCGEMREFTATDLERVIQGVYRRFGYRPIGHRLDLQGLCPSCASTRRRGPAGGRHD